MNRIAQLIQAAEFIDRREREAEHGYASTLPMPDTYNPSKRRSKSKKSQGNRRAHLRNCLERLKDLVPLGVDSSRHTTLGLLTKARSFIKNLEDKERKAMLLRDQLERENRRLRRRLEHLNQLNNNGSSNSLYRVRQERSISECSTSTNSSSSSYSSTCSVKSEESDEIDIIGGFQSDSDDRCSVESLGSDGNGDFRHYSNNFSDDSGVYSGLSGL
ncbi:max dimerization protein 1-like [Plakobranchus ocellatus]|uniref:Max dimerization protein 1-like n=1 Tax=Plakobranchus ocellatus TaxID=259542 RepID=A0AAV4DAD1_9GAST|nr:max dimerization protein 1-like [Plakobranchus ocellatus]